MTATILRAYNLLRPLSPYKARTDLPSFRLFARTNDDAVHGVWRIGLMAFWAVLGAALTGIGTLLHVPYPIVGAFCALFALKLWHVVNHTYPPDPLDWCCDLSWAVAGAYTTAHVVAHAPIAAWVYIILMAVWLVTYPWSTPR